MTPTHNTTIAAATTTIVRWNSPVLYICGGLVVVLCVIACALMTLTCTYNKSYPSSNSSAANFMDEVKPSSSMEFHLPETEAKIAVVMPGEINPTCLASLVPSNNTH
ncbi:hypothetical protein QVD17_06589 [Tagetes erecta]|uniref:Uncharacterized protein n=1 Tax=Tagetes erecta TaxID=13708 RepID=A0AAD8LGA0_TARER|nr:hypothetical protein QVD17_06589 [Tagetes erecta]